MNFHTPVERPTGVPAISHEQPILMMGSCFTEHVGALLNTYKFNLDLNPFGILYNPLSIAEALERVLRGTPYGQEELFLHKGLWHSPMHHGAFSATDPNLTLGKINERLLQAHQGVDQTEWLILTFGTAYVYRQGESGAVVANCHQLPERSFTRKRLTVEEVVERYQLLLTAWFERSPKLRVLLTVSPIRHARDGMHANQLSKATLLLAIDHLCELFPEKLIYFPSYEIMHDELRDYRFYADDMLHPSPLAVRYIWEAFSETFFKRETADLMARIEEINRALEHRPFHPKSDTYKRFLEQLVLKIEQLISKYPYLEFQKEKEVCRIRLNPSLN